MSRITERQEAQLLERCREAIRQLTEWDANLLLSLKPRAFDRLFQPTDVKPEDKVPSAETLLDTILSDTATLADRQEAAKLWDEPGARWGYDTFVVNKETRTIERERSLRTRSEAEQGSSPSNYDGPYHEMTATDFVNKGLPERFLNFR